MEDAAAEDVERLRTDLESAHFFVPEIEEILGTIAVNALDRSQLQPARIAVQAQLSEPCAALTGLFILGLELTNQQVDQALPTLGADGAARIGLLTRQGSAPSDRVAAAVDLRPYAAEDALGSISWWVASDLGEEVLRAALPADHVLGVGGAAKTLAAITVREEREKALDLGTGSGIQALHLSRHCRSVIATDISPRALNFARFNLLLNRLESRQIELRSGSMFAPVAADKFDLLISNPPFVISPPYSGLPEYEYRATTGRGDSVVEQLVTQAGRHLKPGGIAQFLGNWEHHRGREWEERLAEWLDRAAGAGVSLDAWIVEREVQDPAQYAETWLQDGGANPARDPSTYRRAYESWLADFAARDVEGIGFGYVLLRRTPAGEGAAVRRIERVDTAVSRPLGGHISEVLAATDALSSRNDELLNTHFVCPADVTEERYGRPGAVDPALIVLRQGDGFGRSVQVSTWQSAFVGACDGELSAGQICAALAHLSEVEVAQIIAEILPFIRQAIWMGFLKISDSDTNVLRSA